MFTDFGTQAFQTATGTLRFPCGQPEDRLPTGKPRRLTAWALFYLYVFLKEKKKTGEELHLNSMQKLSRQWGPLQGSI